jgi:serine/threonine protein kinase
MGSYQTEYLSRGTYGCVLYPAIPCKHEGENENIDLANSISKVFYKNSNFMREINLHKKVKQADPKNLFTLPPPRTCEFDKSKLQKVSNVEKCGFYKSGYLKKQLLFDYGGYDLVNIPNTMNFYDFFPYFINILFGIILMHKENMIHTDIKPLNILLCEESERMYLIDFGLLSQKNTFYNQKNDFILSHRYLFYPPEFKMYNIRKSQDVEQFLERNCFQRYFKEREHLLRKSYYRIKNDLDNKTDIDAYFNNNMSEKVDIYSLGMVIHYCYIRYNDGSYNDPIVEKFIEKITHPDPFQRY